MKVGDQIRLSPATVRVYELNSDNGLIVDRLSNDAKGYPADYHVLIDGNVIHMGFAIQQIENGEVTNEAK